jgi:hypothetical protein
MPLANRLLREDELSSPEPRFPLTVAFCPSCTLAQLTETVPPESMFREYVYFSSYADTMVRHARELAESLVHQRRLGRETLVVEVGSNDGYLLQVYRARGIPVLGIEPALNVARVAWEERGIPTLPEFFSATLAERLVGEGHRADVLHAHNVLAHVPDLNDCVLGIRRILAPGGVAVIEVPYLRDLLERVAFDTIYHEHVFYFSVTALDHVFTRHALTLRDAERISIHGGSLRLLVSHRDAPGVPTLAVRKLLAEEAAWGVGGAAVYRRLGRRAAAVRTTLRSLLRGLKAQGQSIAGYGAAAKGSTLLNYVGVGRDTLDFVADRSPHKQGRYLPGVHLPVVEAERLLIDHPAYTLLLAWNLADEILAQEAEYRRRGGRFILPLPEPMVVA